MAIGRFILGMGVALLLSLVVACLYAFHESNDDGPIALTRVEIASPNGDWVATLETVDNGLGFGQGMLYDEIHVRRPNEEISNHGDPAESAIFYINAIGNAGKPPLLNWRDAEHLVISYDKARSQDKRPGKCLTHFHGISIECRLQL